MVGKSRVSKIILISRPTMWYHVDSETNPSDLASRGIQAKDLISHQFWWNGPSWLLESEDKWPSNNSNAPNETDEEKKNIKVHFSYFAKFEDILDRFSSFPRGLRMAAYVYRFYSLFIQNILLISTDLINLQLLQRYCLSVTS